MEIWLMRIMNGLTFGGMLFILSAGFTIALGVMKVVNIAHGAFYLIAAYLAWNVYTITSNFGLAILAAVLLMVIIAVATQRFLLSKLHLMELPQTLATMGLLLIIAELGIIFWGGYPRVMQPPELIGGATSIGPVMFPTYRLFIMAVAAGVGVLLWVFMEKTRMGTLVRACVDDVDMARGMGVSVDFIFLLTFGFVGLLAGLGGAIGSPFLGAYQGAEFDILLLALVVVVVGGLGSLRGALIASIVIGVIDSVGKGMFPELAHFTLFAPMIIMLAVRPTGLMGRKL